jgi:hypothetical protein
MILSSHGIIASSISQGVVPLLDIYGSATVAFSLRKLRTAYSGSAIRVRRTDLTEQNIGFTSTGALDTAALLAFVGTGATDNGFVTTWYDQSGNGNNATQTNALYQPQIVSAGNLLTINGKAKLDFNNNNYFNITPFSYNAAHFNSFVGKRESSGRILVGLAGAQYLWALYSNDLYYLQGNSSGYQGSNSTDTSTAYSLLTGLRESGGSMKLYKNASLIASTFVSSALGTGINKIGWYDTVPTAKTYGILQEIVYYNSAQETNRNGIETNINSYYGIY